MRELTHEPFLAIVPLDHRGLSSMGGTTLDPENDDDKEKVDAVICDDVSCILCARRVCFLNQLSLRLGYAENPGGLASARSEAFRKGRVFRH